jgi:hypothetical protein
VKLARFSFVKTGIKHSASTTLKYGTLNTIVTVAVSYGKIVSVCVQTVAMSIDVVGLIVISGCLPTVAISVVSYGKIVIASVATVRLSTNVVGSLQMTIYAKSTKKKKKDGEELKTN